MRRIVLIAAAMAVAPLVFSGAAGAAEVNLHGGGHFQGAGQPLVEAFAKKTGLAANYTPGNTGGGGFKDRLDAGAEIDVVVLNERDMERQVEAGLIRPESVVSFARDGYGVGVLKGAPVPDVSTPEKFREALLAAKAVGRRIADPEHNAGVIVEQIIRDAGILEEVEKKTVYIESSTEPLIAGDVDLIVWSYTEILRADELAAAGPTPPEYGGYVTQAIGIPTSSKNAADAAEFIRFVNSPDGAAVFSQWGMEPLAAVND